MLSPGCACLKVWAVGGLFLCVCVLYNLLCAPPLCAPSHPFAHLHILHRLQHTQRFVDIPPESQVVDGGVLDDAFLVDDEQSTQSGAGLCTLSVKAIVSPPYLFPKIVRGEKSDAALYFHFRNFRSLVFCRNFYKQKQF